MPPRSRVVTALLQPLTASLRDLAMRSGGTILSAISGGPDSTALLHALTALRPHFGFRLVAAHLNHRLRGAEADRDEAFVRALCGDLGVELIAERARGLRPGTANLEERARELRYAFLNRVADRVDASFIALAHHADDQAETVLMRLVRGSGVHGLAAMMPRGPGRLWRPLLGVDRATVLAYLTALNATWVTDQTNHARTILRNRMRHELLPLIEREFAPGISRRLAELASEMRALDNFLTAAAGIELARRSDGPRLGLAGFQALDPALAQAVLREFIRMQGGGLRGIARDHILAMYHLCVGTNPGGRIALPGRRRFRREYLQATLEPASGVVGQPDSFRIELDLAGNTRIDVAGFTFEAQTFERSAIATGAEPTRLTITSMEACFDADRLPGRLAVRNFAAGDRIAPDGMDGTRKLQDLFVDRKLPRDRRANWPIVTAGERILWIPGIARSRVALVTSATRRVQLLRAAESPARAPSIVA